MTYEHFVELLLDKVQIAALSFMALMYAIKIWSLMKRNPIGDRTPKRGDPDAGMRYAMTTIAMPWETESYRKHPMKYVEFALFHLAAAAAITSTVVIPYTEIMIVPAITFLSVALIGMGLVCGVSRLLRRILSAPMRAVSSFDDYFAIILLDVYMLVACIAIPRSGHHEDPWVVAFFGLTTFFLIYVPFSKISHYVLWPFNRYYVGKHFGKRGVYPKKAHNFGPQGAA